MEKLLDRKFLLMAGLVIILGGIVYLLRADPSFLKEIGLMILGGINGYIVGRFAIQRPGQEKTE